MAYMVSEQHAPQATHHLLRTGPSHFCHHFNQDGAQHCSTNGSSSSGIFREQSRRLIWNDTFGIRGVQPTFQYPAHHNSLDVYIILMSKPGPLVFQKVSFKRGNHKWTQKVPEDLEIFWVILRCTELAQWYLSHFSIIFPLKISGSRPSKSLGLEPTKPAGVEPTNKWWKWWEFRGKGKSCMYSKTM